MVSGPRVSRAVMKVDPPDGRRPVQRKSETQTSSAGLNGITCVSTVFTRVQQSGSARYRRNERINRVAPVLAR